MLRSHFPFVVALFVSLASQCFSYGQEKPNVIVIFCDDLGYADIEPFGATHHRTPNLSQMAREGMRLTNFYSTCCVCTPSRSSLMTGCYPKRVGLHENEKGGWVLFPGNKRGLHPDEITIAEILKEQGYATAIVGKWHLGDQPDFLPTRQGFDSYFGIPYSNDMGKTDRLKTSYPATPLLRDEEVIEREPNQRYLTRRYTQEAKQFIEENRDRPFFLYLPHSMPHWPQYASKAFSEKSANKAWGDTVEEIDWSTGEILTHLKALDLDEKTLVIFTSDNGGATHHGAVNRPLRGGKGSTWEGGQRVCCVARWPNQITAGSESRAMCVTMDLLPTLAKIAGAEVPQDRRIDGKDITQILLDGSQDSPHEAFFYYFKGHLNAVRHGQWKLFVKRKEKVLESPELYDLGSDIGETDDVSARHPEIVAEMQQILETMRGDLGDGEEHVGAHCRTPGHVADAKPLTQNPKNALSQVSVFESGADGYHTYRIPSLLTTPSGALLAICEGRKTGRGDHGDLDLVMKRSDDLGETWSDLSLIYEEGGAAKVTIGNPCPVVDQETGQIWLPFCRDNDEVLMTYSDDDGRTWAKPRDITNSVKRPEWGWYATGPGVGIQMTRGQYNGRLVIPCDHREKRDGRWIKVSHVFFSDDHGETWELGANVQDHTDECQVVELHDGRLMINMRDYWAREGGRADLAGMRSVAVSGDGGETWRDFRHEKTLVEPVCQASFLRFSDDKFKPAPLLFSNPASTKRRHQLTVRRSNDQGETWPISKVIHEGPSAYSCLTVLPDRSVGLLYEGGESQSYEKLVFARFTLAWLGKDD